MRKIAGMNCLKMNWSENGCFIEFKSAWPSVNTSSDTQTKKIVCIGRKLLELKQHLLTDKNGNNVLLRDDYRQMEFIRDFIA